MKGGATHPHTAESGGSDPARQRQRFRHDNGEVEKVQLALVFLRVKHASHKSTLHGKVIGTIGTRNVFWGLTLGDWACCRCFAPFFFVPPHSNLSETTLHRKIHQPSFARGRREGEAAETGTKLLPHK